jgi:RimJ/RimL family protein N-acetyltransferase
MKNTIETERLLLRALAKEDADFILELVNTPEWITFIGDRNVRTGDDALKYIQAIVDNPNYRYWAVRLKDSTLQVGIITVIKREYLEHHDIGFAFLPKYSKNGYAFEAAKAVLEMERQSGLHTHILATTLPTNQASIKLLLKLGLTFEKEIQVENTMLHVYSVRVF